MPPSFLTLAPELFDLVIEAYAAEVPLHELFRARVVCCKAGIIQILYVVQ
jgi:hypothetical protein